MTELSLLGWKITGPTDKEEGRTPNRATRQSRGPDNRISLNTEYFDKDNSNFLLLTQFQTSYEISTDIFVSSTWI